MPEYDDDFRCLNCLHSFRANNRHELHEKVCENKYFCDIVMPSKHTEKIEFNQYRKSDKTSSIIYVDPGSLIKKVDRCKNNREKSSTTKASEHIP